MDKIKIYRVEDTDDRGFYNSISVDAKCNRHFYDFCHEEFNPGPYSDGLDCNKISPLHYFGFKNKSQLYKWFTHDGAIKNGILDDLFDYGKLFIKVFEIDNTLPEVMHGNKQLVFIRSNAKQVNSVSFRNITKIKDMDV